MDGSRRSAHGNAYFTGFGKGKRIVFFDTLLNRLGGDEIEAVLAHELGHYKHHHIWKRVGWIAAGSLANYERLHRAKLTSMFQPKFPFLPKEVVQRVVEFWSHAGDY